MRTPCLVQCSDCPPACFCSCILESHSADDMSLNSKSGPSFWHAHFPFPLLEESISTSKTQPTLSALVVIYPFPILRRCYNRCLRKIGTIAVRTNLQNFNFHVMELSKYKQRVQLRNHILEISIRVFSHIVSLWPKYLPKLVFLLAIKLPVFSISVPQLAQLNILSL